MVNEIRISKDNDIENLSYVTLVYMDLIHYAGADTVSRISEILGADKSTVSKKVDSMIRQGLIVKETDPDDRRVRHLSLHPDRVSQSAVYDDPHLRAIERLNGSLSKEEMDGFCKALRIYTEVLGERI